MHIWCSMAGVAIEVRASAARNPARVAPQEQAEAAAANSEQCRSDTGIFFFSPRIILV